MNQNNNFKNENYDDELESFNEEEENDLFINKKELVHIENDTSINVDKSFDEDHSKVSTLKKGELIINNISAINEQFNDTKIVEPNFFTKQLNAELGNINDIGNKKESKSLNNYKEIPNNIQINPNNYFETFQNIATSEENNNIQKNINILNNMIIGKTNYINYEKNKKNDYEKFCIYNFSHKYIGINLPSNNQNRKKKEENISLKEYINKYNQLESNYYNINIQYKKLKKEYDELNNINKSLLELLSYWNKFYLEIKEIIIPKENKNIFDKSINDNIGQSQSQTQKMKVIDEIKKLIKIKRDRANKNFYKTTINNFVILNNTKNNNWKKNLLENKVESFCINNLNIINDDLNENLNNLKLSRKFLDESDDLDFLPPIKYIEKVNIGINTDNTGTDICEFIFDTNKLYINKKVIVLEIKGNKYNIQNSNKILLNQENQLTKTAISGYSSQNFYIKKTQKELQINTLENIFIKGKPLIVQKFKKNTTYKFEFIQTDLTNDNINELLCSKKEKEKIQKQYEEKINILNNYIKNNIDNKNKNDNINAKVNNYYIIKNKKDEKENNSPIKNISNNYSKIFLPEMIPPENTFKIFINCIKNIKYEEGIYQKYIKEDDIYNLKNFVENMEKYILGRSLPILKAVKRKDYIIRKKGHNESSTQKYKDIIISGNKKKNLNINIKKRNTSDSKYYDNRSNSVLNNKIFTKYKTLINKDN